MKKISVLFFYLFWMGSTFAQELVSNPSTYTTAAQGDLYIDPAGVYYIGLQNGTLKEIGILTSKGTTNGDVLTWDATNQKWVSSAPSAAGSGWGLSGNAISNGNFLGTTNTQDLVLRVNNLESGRISIFQNSVAMGYETTAGFKSVAFGRAISTTGNESVTIGNEATGAFKSVAIGSEVENAGTESVAIGQNSTSQFKSVAIGTTASTSNTESIAIGHSATAAFEGIALGTGAISSANNAIAIGKNVTAGLPNTLILGNNHNVGIGTNTPSESLDVGIGNVRLRDYPNSRDDVASQPIINVLYTDANGNVLSAPKSALAGVATVETKTANYTLALADNNKIIEFNSASDVVCTIPSGLPAGFQVSITQLGSGRVEFVGGATVRNAYDAFKTARQYSKAGVEIASTGEAIISGDVAR